jgi:hypothetical protein
MTKAEALAKYLEVELTDIEEGHDDDTFECGRKEYLVLTDDEADEKAKEYILDSVWAFRPEFLMAHMPEGVTEDLIKAVQEKCESANPMLLKLIEDQDHFVSDAIAADGRGHFLNTYDGEENESGEFFIYRMN